jgi:hypothetical protein
MCWLLKLFTIYTTHQVLSFMLPNSLFWIYGDVARYLSIIFLIACGILVIDLFYTVTDKWVANYERHGESFRWMFVLFLLSALMWIGSVSIVIM